MSEMFGLTISFMPFVTRKAHLRTFCSQCGSLQDRLNAATDSIIKIVNKAFPDPDEKSQKLSKALEGRDHVLRSYLEHLKVHIHATAA